MKFFQVCASLSKVKHTRDGIHKSTFLSKDYPFIVLDAIDNWPVMNTDNFWFDNITEVSLEFSSLIEKL